MGLRRFGKAAFLVLSDGRAGCSVPEKGSPREEAYDLFLKSVDVGDIVWVDGPLFLTRTGELTVEAARFRLLTKAIGRFRKSGTGSPTSRRATGSGTST